MNVSLERISDKLPDILIVLGAILGLISFFVNWETFTDVNTTGFDLAFGHAHGGWYAKIGKHCFIPLVIFILSIASIIVFSLARWRPKYHYEMYILDLTFGVTMIALMVIISSTCVYDFEGEKLFFADFIGNGTRLSWLASMFILVGSLMYVASRRRGEDGQ